MFLPIHREKDLHNDLIYRYLTEEFSKVSIFLDTNILLWSLSINNKAFKEFFDFLENLSINDKLVIPNWVIFELEKNIQEQNSGNINFKNLSKRLASDLESFRRFLKLVVDDELAKSYSNPNKIDLIDRFEKAKKELETFFKIPYDKNTLKNKQRQILLKKLLRENSSNIPLKKIIESVIPVWEYRYQNKIPPGFKDKKKESNKQGDLTLWFEILEYCKKNDRNISILITNDNKLDWCSKYQLENKETLVDAHPYLKHEFENEIENGEFYIMNLEDLINLLFSIKTTDVDGHFENYKELSYALGIKLGHSETERIIEWIIRNEHIHEQLILDIAYWRHSPSEIDIERVTDWIKKQIPFKIGLDNVNWEEIIVQILI